MARQRTVVVSALNIRVDPHDTDIYRELLRDAFGLRKIIQIGNTEAAIISQIDFGYEPGTVFGVISRFSKISKDQDWFDTETLRPAGNNIKKTINIPDNIHPNLRPFYFLMHLEKHMLVIESKNDHGNFSALQSGRVISKLLNDKVLKEKYGECEVSIVADKNALSEILDIHILKNIKITIKKPNPDIFSPDEFYEKMKELEAREIRKEIKAVSGKSLTPDDGTKSEMDVALENGSVVAEGEDEDGNKVTRSTENHPATSAYKYNPETMGDQGAFRRAFDGLMRLLF